MAPTLDQPLPPGHITVVRNDEIIGPLDTQALFAGRRVVLFGVPGAFTPTCSERHLPGYVTHDGAFRSLDIDVYCLAVNDAFVMRAWARDQHVPAEMGMLADGNAAFTRALGLELDGSAYGLGIRCRRFALYADDGVVKLLHIEAPGELRVSTAEAMLAALGAQADSPTPAAPCSDCGG